MPSCILHTDGGARGNPGPAGAGVVITAEDGETLVYEAGYFLGETTNNVAEYTGLIRGLDAAARLGFDAVVVRSDSELMVKQLKGVYRVKAAHLKPLHREAGDRLGALASWRIDHVLRAKNKRADALANRAMDAGRDVVPTPLPEGA